MILGSFVIRFVFLTEILYHYFKTTSDVNGKDDWYKNWYARYKNLLAHILFGDKLKMNTSPVAKEAYDKMEKDLIDGYRVPLRNWSEESKSRFNRLMEDNMNKMGKALLGSQWKTFVCRTDSKRRSVTTYVGDCGMMC